MSACNTELSCAVPTVGYTEESHDNHGNRFHRKFSQTVTEASECHSVSSSHDGSSGPRWADMSDSEDDQDGAPQVQRGKAAPPAKLVASHGEPCYGESPSKWVSRGKAAVQQQPDSGHQSAMQARVRNSRHKGGARNKHQVRGAETKHQCQFFIGIEEESKFRVVRRIIGTAGANVKYIAEQAGPDTKLRLRGRGSKFFEGPEKQESPEPLMMCVSVPNRAAYEVVTRLVRDQLERVYEEYDAFRLSNGQTPVRLRVRMHDGPRAGSR